MVSHVVAHHPETGNLDQSSFLCQELSNFRSHPWTTEGGKCKHGIREIESGRLWKIWSKQHDALAQYVLETRSTCNLG